MKKYDEVWKYNKFGSVHWPFCSGLLLLSVQLRRPVFGFDDRRPFSASATRLSATGDRRKSKMPRWCNFKGVKKHQAARGDYCGTHTCAHNMYVPDEERR